MQIFAHLLYNVLFEVVSDHAITTQALLFEMMTILMHQRYVILFLARFSFTRGLINLQICLLSLIPAPKCPFIVDPICFCIYISCAVNTRYLGFSPLSFSSFNPDSSVHQNLLITRFVYNNCCLHNISEQIIYW